MSKPVAHVEKTTETYVFERDIETNDILHTIKVILRTNNDKHTFALSNKISSSIVSMFNPKINDALAKCLKELYSEAIEFAVSWRRSMLENVSTDGELFPDA